MRPRRAILAVGLALVLLHASLPAAENGDSGAVFVEKGTAKRVRVEGAPWKRVKGGIECTATGNILYAGRAVGAGDFHIKARLALLKVGGTAASFVIEGKSHFGFDGGSGKMLVQGPLFGKQTRYLDAPAPKPGVPFTFEVIRKGPEMTFLLDGKSVYTMPYKSSRPFMFGLRPWRSTMRVEEFSAAGQTAPLPPPRTQPTKYSIPTIDLSKEKGRQVVVARGTATLYQGHPTTVLMGDNKTMFAVWTIGHGGFCGPMKKSADGGLTWGDLLPVPDNWRTVKNCPAIHRLTGPDGVERLFVFAGSRLMYQSVSLDGGATWSPMTPNGLHCIVVPITIIPIAGKRLLALYHRGPEDKDRPGLTIWQSISSDGGLTWGPERKVAERPWADPCEPAVIRSPDGKQLAAIMRENSRRFNSLLMLSNDEGETWSPLVEVPASLTGDRHMPRYAHDGRLVMAFRDTAQGSPTKGDFVAWVGTYDDLVGLREGQYRVRLLDSPVKGDLGYPGLELLPDGTFVATTYAVLEKGEKNSVVSVRFTLKDLDEKGRGLAPKQTDIYVSGTEGYHTYRIPALVVSKKGTILAFCEARKNSAADDGDIDLALRRSSDNGKTWDKMRIIWDDGADTIGNPCPVVDRDTGTIWLPICRNNQQVFIMSSDDDGATFSRPTELSSALRGFDFNWTRVATGPGHGIQTRKGRLVIPMWLMSGDMHKPGHEYRSAVMYSDDHGSTWKPGGVTAPTVKDCNECELVECEDGRLYLNLRNAGEGGRRSVAFSADGGETWSAPVLDETLVEPVCQASVVRFTDAKGGGPPKADPPTEDKGRVLFSNPASAKRNMLTVRVSYDEGKTWNAGKLLCKGPSAYSDLCVLPDMTVGCLYEHGEKRPYERITLAQFRLEWLTDDLDRLP